MPTLPLNMPSNKTSPIRPIAGDSEIIWSLDPFSALTSDELYRILAIRQEVFILEQGCFYLDADGLDQRALHLRGYTKEGMLCAYLRAYQTDPRSSIWKLGRVLVPLTHRKKGYGRTLMMTAMWRLSQAVGATLFQLNAQAHQQDFYEALGYEVVGSIFDDAGIPHLPMSSAGVTSPPSAPITSAVRHIIFDLDGTLIDSASEYTSCFQQLAREWARPEPSEVRVRALMFAGLIPQLDEFLGERTPEEHQRALIRFREICMERPIDSTTPYTGAQALLDELRDRGYTLSICTNRPEDLAQRCLERLGLSQYFNLVVGGDRGLERKPDPEMLSFTLKTLKLNPDEAVFIGDSDVDIEAADALSMPIIAARWGYSPSVHLGQMLPSLCLLSLEMMTESPALFSALRERTDRGPSS